MCSLIYRSYCLLKFYCSLICIFVYLLSMFFSPLELLANFFWRFISSFLNFFYIQISASLSMVVRLDPMYLFPFFFKLIYLYRKIEKKDECNHPKEKYFFSHFFVLFPLIWVAYSLRFAPQVRRLLCSARPVAIQTSVNPSASDQDIQQVYILFHNEMTLMYFFT